MMAASPDMVVSASDEDKGIESTGGAVFAMGVTCVGCTIFVLRKSPKFVGVLVGDVDQVQSGAGMGLSLSEGSNHVGKCLKVLTSVAFFSLVSLSLSFKARVDWSCH